MILNHSKEYDQALLFLCEGHGEYSLDEKAAQGGFLVVESMWNPFTISMINPKIEGNEETAFDTIFPGVRQRYDESDPTQWGVDPSWENFIVVSGKIPAIESVFRKLFDDMWGGPRGADDDTADYYPSGLRLLYNLAADLTEITGRMDFMEMADGVFEESKLHVTGYKDEWPYSEEKMTK